MNEAQRHDMVNDEQEWERSVSLLSVLDTIRARKWCLILMVALTMAAGVSYLRYATPLYEVQARLLVQPQGAALKRFSQEVSATQAEVLSSRAIVQTALESLPPNSQSADGMVVADVIRSLDVSPVIGTDVINVRLRTAEPQQGLDVMAALIKAYTDYTHNETVRLLETGLATREIEEELWRAQLREKELTQRFGPKHAEVRATQEQVDVWQKLLNERQTADQASVENLASATVRVLEAPEFLPDPVWPRPFLLGGICLMVGIMGGFVVIGVREIMDPRVRLPEQVQRILNLPVVGHIPRLRGRWRYVRRARYVHDYPWSPVAEVFRALRTRLLVGTEPGRGLVLQLISPCVGEGKSTVTANLALSFAQLGHRVAVVDADLRRGNLHAVFEVSANKGITNVLCEGMPVEEAMQSSRLEGVDVLSRGPDVGNPAEWLAQPEFAKIMETLRGDYDVVLVDSPAFLAVAEASVTVPFADRVVLVVKAGRTSVPHALRVRELLEGVGVKPFGIVVNGMKLRRRYGYDFRSYAVRRRSSLGGNGAIRKARAARMMAVAADGALEQGPEGRAKLSR